MSTIIVIMFIVQCAFEIETFFKYYFQFMESADFFKNQMKNKQICSPEQQLKMNIFYCWFAELLCFFEKWWLFKNKILFIMKGHHKKRKWRKYNYWRKVLKEHLAYQEAKLAAAIYKIQQTSTNPSNKVLWSASSFFFALCAKKKGAAFFFVSLFSLVLRTKEKRRR